MSVNYYLSSNGNKKGLHLLRIAVSVYGTRLTTTLGIRLYEKEWDKNKQRAKGPNGAKINSLLSEIESRFDDYERICFTKPSLSDLYDILRPGSLSVSNDDPAILFDGFVKESSVSNQWQTGTIESARAFKKHLVNWRRCSDDGNSIFSENGIRSFLNYLRADCKLQEVSIHKYYKILRAFLKWSSKKGYCQASVLDIDKPKIKLIRQPVIFLTGDELVSLYNLDISKGTPNRERLEWTRDLFCFCAFTSLRYSDMIKLTRGSISNGKLNITTKKTGDRLTIDLNSFAMDILKKYEKCNFPGNRALPQISNFRMNTNLKILCNICGFDETVCKTFIKGGILHEECGPKWKYMSTHAARRTFICYALSCGIPPQIIMKWTGHSDYKAMKPYIEIAAGTREQAMKEFESNLAKKNMP